MIRFFDVVLFATPDALEGTGALAAHLHVGGIRTAAVPSASRARALGDAARRLGALPGRAVVVEHSPTGVAAGRAGGFGCVIGVAGTATPAELRAAGADLVVADLSELVP